MKTQLLMLAMAILLAAGCATPEARIKKNPDLFSTFPPEAQEQIRAGRIELGFTPEMVEMALGEPNRRYTRQTAGEDYEVWSYTAKEIIPDRQRVNAMFSYRDYRGINRTASDWIWVDVYRESEYERLRVEFSAGKVSAIETLKR